MLTVGSNEGLISMTNSHLQLVPPGYTMLTVGNNTKLTVSNNPNGRKPNKDYRGREYLTPAELDELIKTAKGNRHGHRDATMILLAFRHGLRASELCDLRWDQVLFDTADLDVRRLKGSKDTMHPLQGDELRALRRLKREQVPSEFVFTSERGAPFTTDGFAAMVRRAGAALPIKVHPHMLRHSCGYVLVNNGLDTRSLQDYLGHRNIAHTVRYTELSSKRFKGIWKA